MWLKKTVALLTMFNLYACTTVAPTDLTVDYAGRQTLSFTGKGAAAGIMLDPVIGGAGVAIGIAIDEGIAKDIARGIFDVDPEYNFIQVVKKEFAESTKVSPVQKRLLSRIIVNRYGFKNVAGNSADSFNDAVSPWVKLGFDCSGVTQEINYPEDIEIPLLAELSDIKINGDLAIDLLSKSVRQLVNKWGEVDGCSPRS